MRRYDDSGKQSGSEAGQRKQTIWKMPWCTVKKQDKGRQIERKVVVFQFLSGHSQRENRESTISDPPLVWSPRGTPESSGAERGRGARGSMKTCMHMYAQTLHNTITQAYTTIF